MPKYVKTLDWTSTEAFEVFEEVEKRLKDRPSKELIREEMCWLNTIIRRIPSIEWVVVLKNPPEQFKKKIERRFFKAYLVRRLERTRYPERTVWMMYIVPR